MVCSPEIGTPASAPNAAVWRDSRQPQGRLTNVTSGIGVPPRGCCCQRRFRADVLRQILPSSTSSRVDSPPNLPHYGHEPRAFRLSSSIEPGDDPRVVECSVCDLDGPLRVPPYVTGDRAREKPANKPPPAARPDGQRVRASHGALGRACAGSLF